MGGGGWEGGGGITILLHLSLKEKNTVLFHCYCILLASPLAWPAGGTKCTFGSSVARVIYTGALFYMNLIPGFKNGHRGNNPFKVKLEHKFENS